MPGREAPLPFRNHLPPPSHGHRSPPPDGRPRTPRLPCPRLPQDGPQHEKAWAKKLAGLIRTRRGRQGFSRVELDHGGGGPGQGAVRARDAVDGADHQVLALRAGKAAGRPPVPLPGEGRAAEEDAGPAEVIPPGRMAPAGELLSREGLHDPDVLHGMDVLVRVSLLVGPDVGLPVGQLLPAPEPPRWGEQVLEREGPDLPPGQVAEAQRGMQDADLALLGVRVGAREHRLLVRAAQPSPPAVGGVARDLGPRLADQPIDRSVGRKVLSQVDADVHLDCLPGLDREVGHLDVEVVDREELSRPLLEVRAPDLARPERVVRPPGETQHAGQLDRATLAQVLEVRRLVEGAPELRVRGPLAHRDPDLRTRMTWASAWPPGRTPSSESPRAPAAHAAAARYAAEASKRLKMRPPPAGPRTRAPADRDCDTPSAWPYTDPSSTVFEMRLESEGLARPCPPTTSASAMSSPIGRPTARPANGIQRKPRPSAAVPRTTSARSGSRRASRPTSQPWTTTATRPM